MRKHKKLYWLLSIPVVILIYICYLFLHNPGVEIDTWIPDENISVDESNLDVIDASKLLSLDISPYHNPETIRIYDGWIYAAVKEGDIIRIKEDGTELSSVIHTGGDILGFDIDSHGTIYFCDCNYNNMPSICKYDGNEIVRLPIEDITFPDAICIDEENHRIYFSNATILSPARLSKNPQDTYMIDMMAHTASGKIICYDLDTGTKHTVKDGLCFANGLSLSESKNELFVNETYGNHIWKIHLDDGTSEVLLTVPGYPDNIHSVPDGYWSGLAGDYSSAYAGLANSTLLRKAILNLPSFVLSGNNSHASILFIKYDDAGSVLEYCSIPEAGFTTTGIVETDQRLYIETICDVNKIYYCEKETN